MNEWISSIVYADYPRLHLSKPRRSGTHSTRTTRTSQVTQLAGIRKGELLKTMQTICKLQAKTLNTRHMFATTSKLTKRYTADKVFVCSSIIHGVIKLQVYKH